MLEGLFISLVGMGAVFLSLTIIMFLMVVVGRIFRNDGLAMSEGLAVEGMVAVGEMGAAVDVVRKRAEPLGMVEVAAIALALASHVKERGRELGTSITIDDIYYQVEVGDISSPPTSVIVNGEMYRGAVSDDGLPFAERTSLRIETRGRSTQRERVWRAAYPLLQGGEYWCRRGWTGS
jgi:Na+-transporting methylmalonyl-CoA/oxaloacetate decarboxylase gamma subunit